MLLITSKIEGFRRCGVAHSVAPTEWNDDYFSDEQIARLKAEPMLTVEQLQVANTKTKKNT